MKWLIFYNNGFAHLNHSVGDYYGVSDNLLSGGWHHVTAVFYDATGTLKCSSVF